MLLAGECDPALSLYQIINQSGWQDLPSISCLGRGFVAMVDRHSACWASGALRCLQHIRRDPYMYTFNLFRPTLPTPCTCAKACRDSQLDLTDTTQDGKPSAKSQAFPSHRTAPTSPALTNLTLTSRSRRVSTESPQMHDLSASRISSMLSTAPLLPPTQCMPRAYSIQNAQLPPSHRAERPIMNTRSSHDAETHRHDQASSLEPHIATHDGASLCMYARKPTALMRHSSFSPRTLRQIRHNPAVPLVFNMGLLWPKVEALITGLGIYLERHPRSAVDRSALEQLSCNKQNSSRLCYEEQLIELLHAGWLPLDTRHAMHYEGTCPQRALHVKAKRPPPFFVSLCSIEPATSSENSKVPRTDEDNDNCGPLISMQIAKHPLPPTPRIS
ncbi:hypothetical protein AC579_6575 [Pseudocercospora musae]|uniref:Uncharacterized protein n=1 Tax=Pseudocercospora musae TaxID=113226 RepID=A0A139I9V1_9PEZI|nr:hypothetical protein AC579_6575 [Pseudocercospora musae]